MKGNQAIVIGGSIAGLLAAKVLANHFERVTLVERDILPETAEYRKGIPQARHVHGLLKGGEQVLEQLFPGLISNLKANGALTVNFGTETHWFIGGMQRVIYESGINSVMCSRPMLETAIRNRLKAQAGINFISDTEVAGLITDVARTRVTGVRIHPRHSAQDVTNLLADLVVDASGRESQAPQWLEELGLPAPEETIIDPLGGYASRIYERPTEELPWKMFYVLANPPHARRAGIILPLEGNRLHLTLAGLEEDYPPTDEEGFLEFARSLPIPTIYEIIKQARPLSPISGFRKNFNRMRHFDRLPRRLENFVALGDAVVMLNPMYGQGMSVAALSAKRLADCLDGAGDNLAGLAEQFQKSLVETVTPPWQMVTGQDLQWSKTVVKGFLPQPDPSARPAQTYMQQVNRLSLHNPVVAEAVARVRQLIAPPSSLFHPEVVMQVVAELAVPN